MRKSIYSAAALCLAGAFALADAPVFPQGPGKSRIMQETEGVPYTSTGPYQAASANHVLVLSTGFESPDWIAGPSTYAGTSLTNTSLTNSVCGGLFLWDRCDTVTGFCVRAPLTPCVTNANCVDIPGNVVCTYPVSGAGTCLNKNHAANQNCCPVDDHEPAKGDVNDKTGWSMSPSGRHCRIPSIETINPFAGTQHLRFAKDPLGGNPAGCTGTGSACRTRAISAQISVADISRSVWSLETNWSNTLGSQMVQSTGQDTSVGSISFVGYQVWTNSGLLINYDFQLPGFILVGYWSDHLNEYANFTADYNPCLDKITLSYEGKCDTLAGFCVFSTTPCTTNADCTTPIELVYGFTPPYGDNGGIGLDNLGQVADGAFYTQTNRPSITDIDEHIVTYTACTDACCDGGVDPATCTDDVTALDCSGPSQHYYPNVTCAQLGTADKYPPVCDRDKGSCCERTPGAGGPEPEGVCTDQVYPEQCVGAQFTFHKGQRCAPITNGVCRVGHGQCGSQIVGLPPNQTTEGFCSNGFGKIGAPCENDVDCDVQGFCYPGACTLAAQPGHCSYIDGDGFGLGWCPDADFTCNTDGDCPGATELCDLFDIVLCTVASTCPPARNTENPLGDPLLPQVATGCLPNLPVGCYSAADCPTPTTGGVCNIVAGNRGGDLCGTDADCNVPGTTCLEDQGSCCNTLAGTCTTEYQADCQGAQRVWQKGTLCADAGCNAVLGACCDYDPFGGCTDTTQAGCNCDKCVWSKLQSCFGAGAIECTHNSIPTVSEWGLVVLTLLLLTGAKVYFGRRQAVA